MQKILKFFMLIIQVERNARAHTHTQNVLPSSDQTDDKLVAGLRSRFSFRLTCQHLLLSPLFPAFNAEGRNDVPLRSAEHSGGRSERESAAKCCTGVAHKKKEKKKRRFYRFASFHPDSNGGRGGIFKTHVATTECRRGRGTTPAVPTASDAEGPPTPRLTTMIQL